MLLMIIGDISMQFVRDEYYFYNKKNSGLIAIFTPVATRGKIKFYKCI